MPEQILRKLPETITDFDKSFNETFGKTNTLLAQAIFRSKDIIQESFIQAINQASENDYSQEEKAEKIKQISDGVITINEITPSMNGDVITYSLGLETKSGDHISWGGFKILQDGSVVSIIEQD